MARGDYTLFESFQDKGYWWLPETPDKQVPGILFHNERETRLELFGELYEESLAEKGVVKEPRPVPIIHGWMEDQGICTVYKNHCTGQRMHVPGGTSSTKWSSQALFLGTHFAKQEEIVFSSMSVNFTNLEEWVGEPPFLPPAPKMEGDKLVGYESAYVARAPIEVEIPPLDATFKIDCAPRFIHHHFTSRTQEYAEFASFTPRNPQHFDWYLAAFRDIANLLTLFIGEPVYQKRVVGITQEKDASGETQEKDVSVYLHHRNRSENDPKHPLEMLVALPWIKGWFPAALNTWIEKSSTLRDVYDLYFGSLYSPGAFLQADFLSLIQAVESFSRTRGNDLYVPEETYKPIRDKLLAAIPDGIDLGLRESLEGHVNFGNQHSLRRRVDAILGSLHAETMKLFCPNAEAFRKKIVDTRNYLAHWDARSKKKALHGKALWVANQRLRLLLTILMLKEICFEETAIRERLLQHPTWMQLIHLHLKHETS